MLHARWSLTLRFTFLAAIPSELVVYNPIELQSMIPYQIDT